ncbi:MAG TPA: retroviral-like aspartic protease family protein [Urbifossiella sp.]|nr:retroviral-like aspartic protease family protein [Urbifossiella sp.]
MEPNSMGKVVVRAKIENLEDLFKVHQGALNADQVRTVEVNDALVDTGATGLMMPKRLVSQLGLMPVRTRAARTVNGLATLNIYAAAQLTIQGRDCRVDVYEIPDELPVLIGQIPLEALDWIIDPVNQRLIGNPEHGGQHMVDAF